jgi:hypothetical protein
VCAERPLTSYILHPNNPTTSDLIALTSYPAQPTHMYSWPPPNASMTFSSARVDSKRVPFFLVVPVLVLVFEIVCCRGPFPGARVIQAHMCGRLPRDTLIAAHVPEVPSTVVSADITYFFR